MTSQYTPLWLRSDKNWKVRLQDGWEGDRMLGQGSYGIAGHWKYKGPIETAPNIKDVVVKQSQLLTYEADADPYIEGRLLELLASVESRHILRQYGPLVEDDENGLPVIKLFLEYCPGGDMLRLMESSRIMGTGAMVKKPQNQFLEADIWAMFNCLALGLVVVDRGTEDEFAPAWNRDTEITHNDLKLDNVFMGYRDLDHERWLVFKIADFGVATEEPKVQTFQYGEPRKRGTPNIKPPENDNQGAPIAASMEGNMFECLSSRVYHALSDVTAEEILWRNSAGSRCRNQGFRTRWRIEWVGLGHRCDEELIFIKIERAGDKMLDAGIIAEANCTPIAG